MGCGSGKFNQPKRVSVGIWLDFRWVRCECVEGDALECLLVANWSKAARVRVPNTPMVALLIVGSSENLVGVKPGSPVLRDAVPEIEAFYSIEFQSFY